MSDHAHRATPRLYSGAPPRGWKRDVRALVKRRPGITIPEIAAEVQLAHSHLYRWMPESELVKRGRGWYPPDTPQISAPPRRLPAQLDTDGQAHELGPEHERMRLFEPAPAQLPGQTSMEVSS